ncbi:hypothetical protein PVAND_005255 [Polypedilum vanderplanki]|uniref:Uncharacterized protein n=1 Tax=Polypedilum vanderplanki TaxID=319348 RepID=A0A9J6BZE1_POLVA|nr:hypothetical protein PVAND_005255 [Polypedilum vanderplanki]
MDHRFTGAICIPESCTAENVRQIMKEVFKGTDFVQAEDYEQKNYCVKKNPTFEFDFLRIISIFCFLTITILVIIDTILTNSTSELFIAKFFQCFSIRRNFQTLKDFSITESTITCINGIKAISVLEIFIFHSFSFKLNFPFNDGKEFQTLLNEKEAAQKIVGRTLLNSKKFNFWKFLIQRYMRLTLLTLFLICYDVVTYSLFKLFPKPYVHGDHSIIDDCKNYWWTKALNIQTNVNPQHMCIPPSWFASVLFQLILIAALIHLIIRNFSKTKVFIIYGHLLVCAT